MPKINRGRVVLIHGASYRIKHRTSNMRLLAPSFRSAGFCIVIPTYGFLPALLLGLIPWLDARIAETMAAFISPHDILVGHSNGATLAYLVSKRIKVRGAILINPALDTYRVPAAGFTHVYYNAGDIVTKLSQWLPCHPWGAMGGRGYLGDDLRVTNINQAHPPESLPRLWGHSDIFSVGKCRKWARFMAESCLREVLALKGNHHV